MERFGVKTYPPLSTAYAWTRGDMQSLSGRYLPAEDSERTSDAIWLSGSTTVSSEQYDPVAKIAALIRRQDSAELMLDLFRILPLRKSETSAYSDTVSITDNTPGSTV